MKRLFRGNKSGVVDPLPPPEPTLPPVAPAPSPPPIPQSQTKRSLANTLAPSGDHQNPLFHYDHRPKQGDVTPFPMEMGRDAVPNGHPETGGYPGGGSASYTPNGSMLPPPMPQQPSTLKKSKGKDKGMVYSTTAPSLLEIQQMQAENHPDMERDSRRDQWLATQRSPPPLPPPPPVKRQSLGGADGYGMGSSPEGWSVISGNITPGGVPPSSPSNNSTPTIQGNPALFLPPGARPPSPTSQMRPGTPTRPAYANSQSSYSTSHTASYAPHGPNGPIPEMDPFTSPIRVSRDRGYSSASGSLRSDHDGPISNLGHPPVQKLSKPPPHIPQGRSPLANSYPSPPPPNDPSSFPQAHPYKPPSSSPQRPPSHLPFPPQQYAPPTDQMAAIRIEGPTPSEQDPPPKDRDTSKEGKERKKFWGVGWGDKRDRSDRDRNRASGGADHDAASRFVESFPGSEPGSQQHSSQGHGDNGPEEAVKSTKVLGVDLGMFKGKDKANVSQMETVSAAITLLCTHPDPPFASSYEICDRINHSQQPDNISKEAAHALRKQIKHGNEAERRTAANLWLIFMRNVTCKEFKVQATSRKFLSALEPILLAPPDRPLVSNPTRKIILDILADLTFNFAEERGCEGLLDLWRKVKSPQDPDHGFLLPVEHQSFNPDSFYGFPTFSLPGQDSQPGSGPGSRQSPTFYSSALDVPPPVPVRGRSPLYTGGPGYTALPDHGEDIRRLIEECTAAKESARVLSESLVYTRPEDLQSKPVILEFYRKCFLAHESLTGQIEWAQAEAAQSRERVLTQMVMDGTQGEAKGSTLEEEALAKLFEVHSQLAEALKQHDDLERMARDEWEMKEVRERSRKETRLDRNNLTGHDQLLLPNTGASSSRSPSPAAPIRLPAVETLTSSPRQVDSAPLPVPPRPVANVDRSRTPSPDQIPGSRMPPANPSPLGKTRQNRPLPPNPFRREREGSIRSLGSSQPAAAERNGVPPSTNPSRSGTGSTDDPRRGHQADEEKEEEGGEDAVVPSKPSRKALGKRRALPVDPDNHFDPNDIFGDAAKKNSPASSKESLPSDEAFSVPSNPVRYAYDAYQEKLDAEATSSQERSHEGGSRVGQGSAVRA